MRTLLLPLNYGRDPKDNDIVMFVTQKDIDHAEFTEKLSATAEKIKPKRADFKSEDDMVEAIFQALSAEIGAVWMYCETVEPLTI